MYPTQAFEKEKQVWIDPFYRRWGFTIDRSGSCRQYDLILTRDGVSQKVEEKFRGYAPFKTGFIEVIQDVHTGHKGWYAETGCDYLHYIFCKPPATLYRIDWKLFRPYFEENVLKDGWLRANICTKDYGITVNLEVAWLPLIQRGIAQEVLLEQLKRTG